MAEKVFQLLERLKLAELAKTKSIEQLKKAEQEAVLLKKKNTRILKESTDEGKARVKAELDKKILADQLRALKAHNTQLTHRCKEEVKLKLKEHEGRSAAEEKVKTLGGRLSFLLSKLQADEEVKIINKEEMKKQAAQIKTLDERCQELLLKVNATGESNRIITQALRLKQEEVEALQVKHDALQRRIKRDADIALAAQPEHSEEDTESGNQEGETHKKQGSSKFKPEMTEPDNATVIKQGGKGRFYVHSKPSQGLLLLKASRQQCIDLLNKLDVNRFLAQAQKGGRFKELMVEKLGHFLGLLAVERDEHSLTQRSLEVKAGELRHVGAKAESLQQTLYHEEEAKRRTLLRYVHGMKAYASKGTDEEDEFKPGRINLLEAGVGDEEAHALAALLRGSDAIVEVDLRGNAIGDMGARALSAILSSHSSNLSMLDLRGNRISRNGVVLLAEALERSDRTRHVYVHAGGKIEGTWLVL